MIKPMTKPERDLTPVFIFDLDDTIFHTRSMNPKIFDPFFDHLASGLQNYFDQSTISKIANDLWKKAWNEVIDEYNIPAEAIRSSVQLLDTLEFELDITPYSDYVFIKNLPYPKFLVTTSLTSLQQSKIRALNIENDFDKIVINDPFREKKTKLDVFRELELEFGLSPGNTFVIGDNDNNEIHAGNVLNMITVQILREGVVKGPNARHHITSFFELEEIIKKYPQPTH
jgi:putative hydrolase of the HAD superfamily